jgi:potassium channel subfamily K, other eukaryote
MIILDLWCYDLSLSGGVLRMVLSNVAAFFARPPASQRQFDPEKGREPEVPEAHPTDDDVDEGLPTGSTLVHDDNIRGRDNRSDDDHMDIDEEDEDAIIREVEREEYPEEEPTRHPSQLHNSTLITGVVPSGLSRFWSSLKGFVDTKTSLEDLESYVPQYRSLPILSGIVIPFSILLEIPGLTDSWYIRTVDNKVVETQPNSLILYVGLGFSLACGVIANICLFLRFLEKNVKVMTVLCIIFLTIHGMYK